MNEKTLNIIKEKTKELTNIPYCAPEIKAAADKMFSSLGTPNEADVFNAYIETLEANANIKPYNNAIDFSLSPDDKEALDKDIIGEVLVFDAPIEPEKLETSCGCPACSLAAEILNIHLAYTNKIEDEADMIVCGCAFTINRENKNIHVINLNKPLEEFVMDKDYKILESAVSDERANEILNRHFYKNIKYLEP